MIKLLLVDDDPNVLCGLRMRLGLEPDIAIVGEAQNGPFAIRQVEALHPDIVVMDLQMPEMDGLQTSRVLQERAPEVQIIMLSIRDDPTTRFSAACAGVCGFVGKHQSVDALVATVRDIAGKAAGADCPAK